MIRKKRKVIWSRKAILELEKFCEVIKADSPSNAKKVRDEILRTARSLPHHPEKYQTDEYYPDNPGNIRPFFRWSYRVVYEINKDTIDILSVLHTSKDPDEFNRA